MMRRGSSDISSFPCQPSPTHGEFLSDHGGSPSDQDATLVSIRHATRSNNPELRISMCTPNLLSWLCPMILSSNPSSQTNAIAVVVNLSLEPTNRTRIVKSGILNLLIGLLRNGADAEAKGLIVAAVHSLSVEEKNRTTIGALGAVPSLMDVFSGRGEAQMARQDAGMAIYYLTFSADNRGRVVKTNGSVRRLVGVLKGADEEDEIKSVGMRIVCNLARCEEGRSALMEANGVAVMVGLIEKSGTNSVVPERRKCWEDMAYMAAAAVYGMSKGKSLRFRCMAKSANAEEVFSRVLEERGGAIGEMARRTIQAMRGDGEEEQRDEWYEYTGGRGAGGLGMSEPMKRRYGSFGGNTAVSGPN
ncbi:U-box domain-containing protein 38 [Rhynchospora pubera]|uniref:U-box domain-containing protein 38 n=1 Tax=Rhynchospora pubera TaxID=906938 RepID=A0AAV8FLU1_9POAL|nr:U-box domain-containing protein 38 [Rhynchospora pubera]